MFIDLINLNSNKQSYPYREYVQWLSNTHIFHDPTFTIGDIIEMWEDFYSTYDEICDPAPEIEVHEYYINYTHGHQKGRSNEDTWRHFQHERFEMMGVFDGHGGKKTSTNLKSMDWSQIDFTDSRDSFANIVKYLREKNPSHGDDGSTISLVILDKGSNDLHFWWIGDSPILVYHDSALIFDSNVYSEDEFQNPELRKKLSHLSFYSQQGPVRISPTTIAFKDIWRCQNGANTSGVGDDRIWESPTDSDHWDGGFHTHSISLSQLDFTKLRVIVASDGLTDSLQPDDIRLTTQLAPEVVETIQTEWVRVCDIEGTSQRNNFNGIEIDDVTVYMMDIISSKTNI